jgi:hypothetical protein
MIQNNKIEILLLYLPIVKYHLHRKYNKSNKQNKEPISQYKWAQELVSIKNN